MTSENRIETPIESQNIDHLLDGQTASLWRWLLESETVIALLLAPDGVIRARNRAARQTFFRRPSDTSAPATWDCLLSSGVPPLSYRLSDSAPLLPGPFTLNLTGGVGDPITLEALLLPCAGAILLLAIHKCLRPSQIEAENITLSDDLSAMTRQVAAITLELQQAQEAIERLARTDVLTGLANRRTLHEALRLELARAERHGGRLSVIIADLDDFKSINDHHGHLTGDRVLSTTAAVFGGQLRPYDLAARYGGEEFVLLLPGASLHHAVAIADRIRREIAQLSVPGCPREITVSLGVAGWITGDSPENFIARADTALFNAKSNGRNRIEAAAASRS